MTGLIYPLLQTKQVPFIEYIFHTLALHNGFSIETPQEFQKIEFRHDWEKDGFDNQHLFHPVKDMRSHSAIRKRIVGAESSEAR